MAPPSFHTLVPLSFDALVQHACEQQTPCCHMQTVFLKYPLFDTRAEGANLA
jgi:hypothetical protein